MKRWTRLTQLAPPVFPGDENKTRRAILLNTILLTSLVLALCFIASNLAGGNVPLAVSGVDIVVFGVCLVLRRWAYQGRVGLASGALLAVALIAITLAVAMMGTIRAPATAVYVFLVIAAGLLFDLGGMIAMTVLCALALAGLIVAENAGLLPRPNYTVTITQWVTYTVLFVWAGSLTLSSLQSTRRALARAEQEIAERKRAEEALREREQRLASIYDTVGDVIFQLAVEKDGRYRFASVNRAFLATTGLTSAQAVGKRVDEVIPEPSLSMVLEKYAAAIREKGIVRWEETSEYPTGRLIGEVNIAPVFDSAGNCTHLVGAVHDITERRRAEVALRESEARYHTLVEHIPVVTYLAALDESGSTLYISPQIETMLGFSPAEWLADPALWSKQLHAEDRERVLAEVTRAGSASETFQVEYRLIGRDGRVAWIQDAAAVMRDETGQARFLHGIILDITERKRLERELQDERDLALQVFNTVGQGLTVTDEESRFVRVNPAYARLFGYAPQDLLGKHPADLTAPEDRAVLAQAHLDREQGKITTYETRLIRKDGSYAHVLITGAPRCKDGEYAGAIAAIADITELKQVEESLRESEERYQLANRATFNAIWDRNLQTDALWWNENFQTLFGYRAEEIEPGIESWTNRIHPDDLARVEAGIYAAINSGQQSWSDHYRFRRKDGTYAEIDDRGYISREASGKPVRMIGAMQDVTERKQAAQHAFELALERERMALLSKFIQDVSHEFRTPLAIMQTNVYLLERLEDPAKRQRKLAQIGDQVAGLTRLVDLLAEMARLDSGVSFTTQPTDLNGLVGAVAAKLQTQAAAKGLTLRLELAPDLPSVPADGNRLGEALHELLNNAVRFTPAGGSITVRSASDADGVTVEVQDTGPGIAADVLPHIFERFYRQDVAHTTPGFGLGLPIARAIVERHGGRLDAESQPGAGSVFRIVLPGPAALPPVGQ